VNETLQIVYLDEINKIYHYCVYIRVANCTFTASRRLWAARHAVRVMWGPTLLTVLRGYLNRL